MMATVYKLENVGKTFSVAGEELEIFKNLNLDVEKGEALAIVGSSGSGKSTLLHLMGALDRPSRGEILFAGESLASMSQAGQAHFRNRRLGFVFQFHHLLPEFSALENVALPGLIAGRKMAEMLPRARQMLERVGLGSRMGSRPATLSGGERQRAAIARALILNPEVILADEPTGNLDEHTGAQVGELLLELNRELGMTLVVVTHNQDLAARMGRILELRGGALYEKAFS
ncbi:MAG: ABC transporter ATP-binding protein [Desulfovibrio sp.]|nr:ABC transporter ATP-binding protein [Desulfovibrio sp.]